MAMPSSKLLCERLRASIEAKHPTISESKMVPELRPVMPVDLLSAAIKGNRDVLIHRLGLQSEERTFCQVTIDPFHPTYQQMEADQHAVQHELGSATHFGDTLLHLLVTKMHNELALMVFQRNRSLLNAHNKDSETPLHCAAKVGNLLIIQALIQHNPNVVKDALREMNNNGDTALHVAAQHGHGTIVHELMNLDQRVACMVNMEELSPLYIATVGGYTSMVKTMLEDYPSLACEQYSNGMCPVHVAARVGNIKLVMHFMEEYPEDAELLDYSGQNLFHFAAEENIAELFTSEMGASLINARDHEGNTPLHIAAIKGHTSVMKAIYKILTDDATKVENNQAQTPFDLSKNQIEENATKDMQRKINSYVESFGRHFTQEWFDDIMQPYQNKWERTQVIGLGSVLITTVTFAAAFAIPGGYSQDSGAPILGRKYMFKAFILANTQSFLQAFVSLFTLVSSALADPDAVDLHYASYTFIGAAGCMVLAFGLGSYVMLAPVSLPIAIIVLLSTLHMGSPFMYHFIELYKFVFGISLYGLKSTKNFSRLGSEEFTDSTESENGDKFIVGFGLKKAVVFQIMLSSLLFIFLFALS